MRKKASYRISLGTIKVRSKVWLRRITDVIRFTCEVFVEKFSIHLKVRFFNDSFYNIPEIPRVWIKRRLQSYAITDYENCQDNYELLQVLQLREIGNGQNQQTFDDVEIIVCVINLYSELQIN